MDLAAGSSISLAAAIIAGLAGSAHCFAMCGGLAGALGMRARARAAGAHGAFGQVLAYQAGRLSGYTIAGALFGLFGAGLQAIIDLPRLAVMLRVASGALLVLIALRVLFAWNTLAWLDALGVRFWRRLQPVAQHAARAQGAGHALALGLLWGWLPCGLVYSMLAFAALSGSAWSGALILLAFGIGTLPSMLTSTLLASQLHRWLSRRWPRLVGGALLLAFGLWLAGAAIHAGSHSHGSDHAPPSHAQHGAHLETAGSSTAVLRKRSGTTPRDTPG